MRRSGDDRAEYAGPHPSTLNPSTHASPQGSSLFDSDCDTDYDPDPDTDVDVDVDTDGVRLQAIHVGRSKPTRRSRTRLHLPPFCPLLKLRLRRHPSGRDDLLGELLPGILESLLFRDDSPDLVDHSRRDRNRHGFEGRIRWIRLHAFLERTEKHMQCRRPLHLQAPLLIELAPRFPGHVADDPFVGKEKLVDPYLAAVVLIQLAQEYGNRIPGAVRPQLWRAIRTRFHPCTSRPRLPDRGVGGEAGQPTPDSRLRTSHSAGR